MEPSLDDDDVLSFGTFPGELLQHVALSLSVEDVLSLMLSCQHIYDSLKTNEIWAPLFSERFFFTRRLYEANRQGIAPPFYDIYESTCRHLKRFKASRNILDENIQYELSTPDIHDGIWSLQYKDDRLAVGTQTGIVGLWDMKKRELLQVLDPPASTRRGHGMGLMFNDQILARGAGNQVEIWRWNEEGTRVEKVSQASFEVSDVRCIAAPPACEDGVITLSTGQAVQIWDLNQGGALRHSHNILCPAIIWYQHLVGEQRVLIAGDGNGALHLMDTRAGEGGGIVSSFHAHDGTIWKVDCASAAPRATLGHKVCTASGDQTVKVWDTRTWRCVHDLKGHRALVGDVAADESKIISCSNDGTIKIWDMKDGKQIHSIQQKASWVWCVQFDDDKLVSGSTDGSAVVRPFVWDAVEGGSSSSSSSLDRVKERDSDTEKCIIQ
eukprot:TRINITY_DN7089_c0_g1_i4.p1 TRINITY_DN7089_c0_g1~~TRINITY_DN7089_c0_g1_i4.p1  ORF type:complete len:439 (+),score=73.14 TRINITY_DN7089_c0_g1_i4:83-1399(+)